MELLLREQFWMTYILISVRCFSALMVTQLITHTYMPTKIKIMLLLVLSYFVATLVPEISIQTNMFEFVFLVLKEILIGSAFAFGILTAFAAINFGYRLIEFQMGLSMSEVIDPVTKSTKPLLGYPIELLAIVLFFLANLHYYLIKVLVKSYELFPVNFRLLDMDLMAICMRAGIIFSAGVAIVAPVLIAVLLLDIGLAYFARTMPQVNIFFVAIPLKILVGLIVLLASLEQVITVIENNNKEIFEFFSQVRVP